MKKIRQNTVHFLNSKRTNHQTFEKLEKILTQIIDKEPIPRHKKELEELREKVVDKLR